MLQKFSSYVENILSKEWRLYVNKRRRYCHSRYADFLLIIHHEFAHPLQLKVSVDIL